MRKHNGRLAARPVFCLTLVASLHLPRNQDSSGPSAAICRRSGRRSVGHPVYFVIFFSRPEPGQTLEDVCEAEGQFVETVVNRHPQSPKPVLVGNCQGGWATMMLAASRLDSTGPVLINGALENFTGRRRTDNRLLLLRFFIGRCRMRGPRRRALFSSLLVRQALTRILSGRVGANGKGSACRPAVPHVLINDTTTCTPKRKKR
jgi:Protein of unknown function (DUF3141)